MNSQSSKVLLCLLALFNPPTWVVSQSGRPGESGFGQVHFPISATAPAQAQFDRAVAMLHSFWYEEVEREFKKVLELDPDCAMACWGIAMGLWHPLWEQPSVDALSAGLAAVEKGRSIGAKTAREQAYLNAVGAFYQDYRHVEHSLRVRRYTKAMREIHVQYPSDTEATAFYALGLLASAPPNDRACTNQLRAAALLEQVAVVHSNHPGVVHYLIHAYDTPSLASRGLREAWCYSQIAPEIPHALHMPSHIYTRLGLWRDSIRANLASQAAAGNYAAQVKMVGTWDEQLHALDYLVYAYLQTGQDRAAGEVVRQVLSVTQAAPQNFKSAYALASIPARYLLERRQWAEAAKLELTPKDFPWSNQPWPLALHHFARCLGAARTGHVSNAQQELKLLSELQGMIGGTPLSYNFRQVAILQMAAQAWTAHAEGREEDALRWMRQAAEQEDAIEKQPVTPGPLLPARELLGDLLLETGRPHDALAQFHKSLTESPKRFNGLYGAAQAAVACGATQRAEGYFAELLASCEAADSERPELLAARRAVKRR